MLEYLHLENVGPAPSMTMELAPRLNLITGDNGLGKSFLLDVAWWALTRRWPHDINGKLTSGYRALPRNVREEASIEFRVESKATLVQYKSIYSREDQAWKGKRGRPHSPGLVIYAHSDGGFSVWDPVRNYWKTGADADVQENVPAYVFTPTEVWEGLSLERDGRKVNVCRGLLDDWAVWIRENGEPAKQMAKILASLAAPGETLEIGPLLPLSVDESHDYPTIRTSYANDVRIIHASAGIRRCAALAYMLMWSWERHVAIADAQGLDRADRVILLFDEIESHLHPRWQRSILRSVLDVAGVLHGNAAVQLIAATHSPLVLASAEPFFDESQDAWFDLELDPSSGSVELQRRPFVHHGDVSNWLTSDAFDLKDARSREAEAAIERARALLRDPQPTIATAREIDNELKAAGLPGIDPFWVRWSAFVDRLAGEP